MKNEWDEYAQNWDIDPSVSLYANKVFTQLNRIVDIKEKTILDFGCGTGALTQLMSPIADNITAIDPSSEMIKKLAQKKLKNVATISDYLSENLILQYPALNNQFDIIVASSVCGFVPEYEVTLGLLKSLLKNDGLFVQWDWLSEEDNATTGLTELRVKNAFEAIDFNIKELSSPFIMQSEKGSMPVLMAVGENAVKN
ncbi:class I SAM-dependent DNA methyltransferase [Pseudoalteromonas denitrificans]|uniref:Methyltransferase domain-containing protein n=1 Tax=Pseudoalteromonas denitrificans DSM 6059 TaxID=1123010 RepID=A0A1I1MXI1_9GAMM|nr:class I SAM-dependent methyltransferase [Pseudoalteromonas denitrificans]SFC89816.1 Methyltransferase domain-containing protein [Pseudoalteromonas denitrificans DSM 6059]